jgi:hypothetical protein
MVRRWSLIGHFPILYYPAPRVASCLSLMGFELRQTVAECLYYPAPRVASCLSLMGFELRQTVAECLYYPAPRVASCLSLMGFELRQAVAECVADAWEAAAALLRRYAAELTTDTQHHLHEVLLKPLLHLRPC